jgi:hypothetical protein
MAAPMSPLLEEISREHFPYPPATLEEINAFEQQAGWPLDPELKAFYLHCNGAELIERLPEAPYRILPLQKILRARAAIFGTKNDDDAHGPASMYAICEVQDGNYVLVDVAQQNNGCYPLIDGWHEAWPAPKHCGQIARSFSDFLERALHEGPAYWLEEKGAS